MNNFGTYARYYDQLYKDKDYAQDVGFVDGLIKRHSSPAVSLLDLGCGTGTHAFLFAERGYQVACVDRSPEMVAEAKARAGELPQIRQAQLEFIEGDICNIHLDRQFDIVTSLFHVISYQTSNEALAAAFVTARSHTAAGGLFIFDFWYGPGVLSDPPRVRIKRIATPDGRELIRVSEPTFRQNENCVDVDFTLFVFDKQKRRCDLVREQHPMRYLFVPEIYGLAERSGFKVLEVMEWLTNRELALCSWNACVVAQAVD